MILFDTTLRDGELAPGVRWNAAQKVAIAQWLDQIGIDVIEVGYPGHFKKDAEEIRQVAQAVRRPIICGLASSKREEIEQVAAALQGAERSRINLFTSVNLKHDPRSSPEVLALIQDSVSLAKQLCEDVQWNAFDASRSQPEFLCQAIEAAIASGATTITIPDSLGVCSPDSFAALIQTVVDQVPNLAAATLAVHCHDDLGYAVENSIVAFQLGVEQIECSVNGLGARKGNANLATLIQKLQDQGVHLAHLQTDLLPFVAAQVADAIAV